jgi:hypothetical protein
MDDNRAIEFPDDLDNNPESPGANNKNFQK